jgi:acyl-CoA synthetase (AMP-forming)/AMP-acid ligase II
MAQWNYADIWEQLAAAQPERPAVFHGQRTITWREFDNTANALAARFLEIGAGHQAKIATYLYNCPEYLITTFAAFKAGMVPFNVNYRYGPDELFYLLDNADAEIVIFDAEFAETLDAVRGRLPRVRLWIALGDQPPTWAEPFDRIAARETAGPNCGPWGRSGEDLPIVYTGGTTGMPKGVMWRQEDIFGAVKFYENTVTGAPPMAGPDEAVARTEFIPRSVSLSASPLMHATGLISSMGALVTGGAVVLLPSRKFDAVELLDEAQRCGATRMSIVGLAFATPILEVLDAHPGRWTLPALRIIGSSGAMWSNENKRALLKHLPHLALMDSFASSEAFGMGLSTSTAGGESTTARFELGETCAVFTEDGRRVEPGADEIGKVAISGHMPVGYYNDPEKTAATFPVIEGRRWCMPGDWARVEADGLLSVLGRGSQCINTGGEKVFPEEVEEALKRHPAVRDAAVVGLPHPRFGETVAALVEVRPGAAAGSAELMSWVRSQLADYKTPRIVIPVDSVRRAPNGKLDYKAVKARALDTVQTRL